MIGSGMRLSLLVIGFAALSTGCVERRFVVETNVPGAQIYVNDVPVGPSPADARWDYAGKYNFRVIAQGYEPLNQIEKVKAKWYDYPPLDFVFETLWPFHIEDVRRFHFDLVPTTQIRTDELLDAANDLRNQASQLPPPQYPAEPKRK
ncbi:PEGA domain-containing protein [soil metagenome]